MLNSNGHVWPLNIIGRRKAGDRLTWLPTSLSVLSSHSPTYIHPPNSVALKLNSAYFFKTEANAFPLSMMNNLLEVISYKSTDEIFNMCFFSLRTVCGDLGEFIYVHLGSWRLMVVMERLIISYFLFSMTTLLEQWAFNISEWLTWKDM